MKPLILVAAIAAAALGGIGAAVFGAGDRSVLVPPPEAVAEGFTRELVEHRYDLALRYLSRDLRRRTSAATLGDRFDPVWQRLGKHNQVDAELQWMQGSTSAARAFVAAQAGHGVLQFRLVREHGLWRIAELPAEVATGVRAQ